MGGNSIAQGIKWVGLIILYFFIMIVIVTVVEMSVTNLDGDITATDLQSRCGNPRTLWNINGSIQVSDDTGLSSRERAWIGVSLTCKESVGVTAQSSCEQIEGCSWSSVSICPWYYSWCGETQNTCTGNINGSFYGISPEGTGIFSGNHYAGSGVGITTNAVDICEDFDLNVSSCLLLSCSWLGSEQLYNIRQEEIKLNQNMWNVAWNSVGQLITFRYDFGFDTYANWVTNFIIFYLPLLLLILAIYAIVPFI
jgi:hypothetical protein